MENQEQKPNSKEFHKCEFCNEWNTVEMIDMKHVGAGGNLTDVGETFKCPECGRYNILSVQKPTFNFKGF